MDKWYTDFPELCYEGSCLENEEQSLQISENNIKVQRNLDYTLMIKQSETPTSLKNTGNGSMSLLVWKKNKTAWEVINNELLLRSTSASKGKNVLQNASCICTDEIIKISTFEIRGWTIKKTKWTEGYQAFMLIKWWTYREETNC